MIQPMMIIQRAIQLSNEIYNKIQENHYSEARDHALQTISLIELLNSFTSSQTNTSLNRHTKVCVEVLNYITRCPLLNDSLTLPYIPSEEVKEIKNDENGEEDGERMKYSQIIGSEDAKQTLYENIVLPLSLSKSVRQEIFRGVRSSGGNVLLFGPPGTGKTCLAQATASESASVLFSIRPSEVLSKYQGESERYISRLFETAKKLERAIIFFDGNEQISLSNQLEEFDSLATSRGLGEDCTQHRRLLAELLLQLTIHKQQASKIGGEASVVVIAATNRLEDLDEAILRRFDCKIFVGTPNCENRIRMIEFFLEGISNSLSKQELHDIANGTEGWSGAEIQSLCREAAMIPVREAFPCARGNLEPDIALRTVNATDFDTALQAILKPHLALEQEGDQS